MSRAVPTLRTPEREERSSRFWILLGALVVALLASVLVSTQTMWSMRDHGHAYWRMFLWQAGCWGFWVAVAPLAVRQGRALLDPRRRPALWPLRLTAWAVGLTAAHIALTGLIFLVLQPYEPVATYSFAESLDEGFDSLLRVGPLIYGIEVVVGYGLAGYFESRRAELRRTRLEAELAHAQLEALRLEIQPHFLFNSLNSIAGQIRLGGNDEALDMVLALSELLRATLERSRRPVVELTEELDLLQRYVRLQHGRFGDRLTVEFSVEKGCEGLQVPVFLLQPLVENSIRHGLGRRAGEEKIVVRARRLGETLVLSVVDDGPGLPEGFDLDAVSGLGLKNVRSRLTRLYGDAGDLKVENVEGGGAEVTVALPANRNLQEAVAS